jgi:alpha-amylase
VLVHLFEWKWTDIAAECEHYLGPAGFTGVQVSPPSEHAVLSGYPWYERYQTVNYSLAQSRSGSEAEFKDMVQRCARVGVGIYVDAVINHMTAIASGIGSNGTHFTKYEYSGLYTKSDFHSPTCAIAGTDYTDNADHVRACELVGLADLDTGSETVRDKIGGYLNSLVDLGVAGFRIDAAKHMAPADVDAIVQRVNQHVTSPKKPFVFLEVIDNGNEAIHASEYLTVGMASGQAASITDFQFSGSFDRFMGYSTLTVGQFRTLKTTGNLLPSAQAVVFTTNHDTERADAIYYKDGKSYELATVFLLASPYGYPSLMSSFAFDRATDAGRALGPPSTMGHTNSIYAAGSNLPNCAPDTANPAPGSWVCQHRASFVAPMLAFRKATAGTELANFWDNGKNQVGFARGDKGFVVINREDAALSHAFTTGLAAGSYCDVIAGGLKDGACLGSTVTVDVGGMATIDVPAMSALAIHVGQKK